MGKGGPSRPQRSIGSRLGLNDLRAITQSVSDAYALPNQGHHQQQHPRPPPHDLSRGRPDLAAAAIAARTQCYRPPKDIGYHEITPSPYGGPAALYILMLEPSVATGNRRCTTFMILNSPFQEDCRNSHFSCNQENGEWRVRVEERRKGTPRTETQSLLTLDFVAFVDLFQRNHLQKLLTQPLPPSAHASVYFNSQSWSHSCMSQLQQSGIISEAEFICAQRKIVRSMAIPFFSLKPNSA